MSKRVLSLVLAFAMILGSFSFVAADSVKDIDGIWSEDVIQYLIDEGIVEGYEDGTFLPRKNVTRAEFMKMINGTLGFTEEAEVEFSDVPANAWFHEHVAVAVGAGYLKGNVDNTAKPNDNITREEAATMLGRALELEVSEDAELSFTDADKVQGYAAGYVSAIAELGHITGFPNGTFEPQGTLLREQAASILAKAHGYTEEVEVVSVSAINEKTLEVTGTGLNNLTAEDIDVAGNVVVSVTANNLGTKATVTFQNGFPLDAEQTVKVGEEEFKFTYSIDEIKSVSLDDKTVDDDTKGQILTFKINGATADTEWLRQAGYTVNFAAADEDNVAADIFEGASATSTTGLLDDEIDHGKYSVEIQISKDGKIVVSDKAIITVTDLESTTTLIDKVTLTTDGGVKLNSTTLVVGEKADITKITGNAAGKTDVELPVGIAELTTSNDSVISVNNQELSANVAGTATITVTIGNVTKTLNLTVKSDAREVAKVTPSETTVKVVVSATRTIEVTTLDQYGDPIAVVIADITEDVPENASGVDLVTAAELVTGVNGKTSAGYTIQGAEKGNGTILFKDADDKVVGQIAVQVTDEANEGSTKVEHPIATTPVEYTIDVDDTEDYQVSIFNTKGFYNGVRTLNIAAAAADELFVESADIDVATVTLSGTTIKVTGVKEGKTDITFKNEAEQVVHKITVTIEEEDVTITKVSFKSASTIDYIGKAISVKDILDVRVDGSNDPIVYGVEHNADTIAKVRLDESSTGLLILYIDDNDDGDLNAAAGDDTILGAINAEVLSGATNLTVGKLTDISSVGTSLSTDSGDKGTILFRVIVDNDGTPSYPDNKAVATTTLNINVK